MEYSIRKAEKTDLPCIERIYGIARNFMKEHGNPTQWGRNYPPAELLMQDILAGELYLITDNAGVHGVFYFCIGPDPTYAAIYHGRWLSDDAYGTLHRIAGDGSGGILRTAVAFGLKQINHLRIDTHQDNKVMQDALHKLGFRRCGIIYIEDGSPRIAYEKIEETQCT